jgi:hypothetical protein
MLISRGSRGGLSSGAEAALQGCPNSLASPRLSSQAGSASTRSHRVRIGPTRASAIVASMPLVTAALQPSTRALRRRVETGSGPRFTAARRSSLVWRIAASLM